MREPVAQLALLLNFLVCLVNALLAGYLLEHTASSYYTASEAAARAGGVALILISTLGAYLSGRGFLSLQGW